MSYNVYQALRQEIRRGLRLRLPEPGGRCCPVGARAVVLGADGAGCRGAKTVWVPVTWQRESLPRAAAVGKRIKSSHSGCHSARGSQEMVTWLGIRP